MCPTLQVRLPCQTIDDQCYSASHILIRACWVRPQYCTLVHIELANSVAAVHPLEAISLRHGSFMWCTKVSKLTT